MFWINTIKKKKELDEKLKLIGELDKLVDETASSLRSFCREIDEGLENCAYIRSELMWLGWKKIDSYGVESRSIEEIKSRIEEVKGLYATYIPKITEYWAKVQKNERELEKWYKDGVPLFITLTYLVNGLKLYAMCYEFKKNKNGGFDAYVFFSNNPQGKIFSFDKFDYKIDRMTETEFENEYIMGRMSNTSFESENDAVEYDNSIRRLFHGQRDVIA